MDFWSSLGGMMTVELTSADPVNVLQTLSESGIVLTQVEFIRDLTVRCQIRRRDYRKLLCIAKKRGDGLRICGRSGLYWSAKSLLKRPVLLIGVAVLLVSVLIIPTRILFVRVEGNNRIPARQIQAAAEDCGIRFWVSRREVRSEKVKNALLGSLPELEWAGVNTKGCVAVISVRERAQTKTEESGKEVRSIVAARDGVVESCTATEGNLLCKPGQAVKEGEVLISAYTDCGICIRVSRAEGEIFATTRHEMDVITLSQVTFQGAETAVKKKYSLLVGKKRINLWKGSGIWQGSCDRMYEEYYITLPGGFSLPFAFVREIYLFHEIRNAETETDLLQKYLTDFGRQYLSSHMVAGRILSGSESFYAGNDTLRMEGRYFCSEMIGRVQTEKIGE